MTEPYFYKMSELVDKHKEQDRRGEKEITDHRFLLSYRFLVFLCPTNRLEEEDVDLNKLTITKKVRYMTWAVFDMIYFLIVAFTTIIFFSIEHSIRSAFHRGGLKEKRTYFIEGWEQIKWWNYKGEGE